jgi:hypothetical protein
MLLYLVNKPMFVIDSPRPATFELVFQRLRFSGASERIALNFSDETDDSQSLCSIMLHPLGEILEGGGIKFQVFQRLRQARNLLGGFLSPKDDVS